MDWWRFTVEETLERLGTCPSGLSAAEAAERLAATGPNALKEAKRRSPLAMLGAQFADFAIMVLMGAALVAGAIGDLHDAAAIAAIVLINAVIGFSQEFRAERAMEALRKMAAGTATVLRRGEPAAVPTMEIVPGDVVVLEAGNVVPADLRLTGAFRLQMDESLLTGESLPVVKTTEALTDADPPLGERMNLVFRGTVVVTGRGSGVAVATGMATELGRIAALVEETEETRTPLQKRLAAFGRRLALVILAVCALVFFLGFLRGEPFLLMMLTAVSLAVAAIPEALPAVVTIALAFGARRMVRENALIRRLPAVESLGAVTCICTDKTGTLTRNRMSVECVWIDGKRYPADALRFDEPGGPESPTGLFLTACALCSDVKTMPDGILAGDPTEVALLRLARDAGFPVGPLSENFPRLDELPFDPERKRMTTFHRWGDGVVSFTKGAVEEVIPRAGLLATATGRKPFEAEELQGAWEEMARTGLRVIALAMRRWEEVPPGPHGEEVESDLVLLGLAGLFDPPREEAPAAVAACRSAGIVPVMITGDHPETARAVAERVGILAGGEGETVTGRDLASMSEAELSRRVAGIRVYARVVPEDKLSIVAALQRAGEVVAMTGDGVNDAPALKKADIGVAMGLAGTDVAREAADLVLLDDNFATIVGAVREGRRIYANILKFITYSLTANTGTLVVTVLAPLAGLPLPLSPLQILWLNLLCDSLPGLALAAEAAGPEIMARPPVKPDEGVFAKGRGLFMFAFGTQIGVAALFLQLWAIRAGAAWQTMVFTFLILNRLTVAQSVRSDRLSLRRVGFLTNRPLAVATLVIVLLQLTVVYLSPLTQVFGTVPLSWRELLLTCACALGMLAVTEVEKGWLHRRS